MNGALATAYALATLTASQLRGQDAVRSQLPPNLDSRIWKIPDAAADQYGNPVVARGGVKCDPKTGWPYEVWLDYPRPWTFTGKPSVQVRMEFILIPAATYMISDLRTELEEHRVGIAKPNAQRMEWQPSDVVPPQLTAYDLESSQGGIHFALVSV